MRFWRRKEEAIPGLLKDFTPSAPSNVCRTCGCLVAPDRGKRVEDGLQDKVILYCEGGGCAPPYDRVTINYRDGEIRYYSREPAHLVRVTERGKPIKVENK